MDCARGEEHVCVSAASASFLGVGRRLGGGGVLEEDFKFFLFFFFSSFSVFFSRALSLSSCQSESGGERGGKGEGSDISLEAVE